MNSSRKRKQKNAPDVLVRGKYVKFIYKCKFLTCVYASDRRSSERRSTPSDAPVFNTVTPAGTLAGLGSI